MMGTENSRWQRVENSLRKNDGKENKIRYKGVYYERYYFSRRFRHTPVLRYSGKIAFMINIEGK